MTLKGHIFLPDLFKGFNKFQDRLFKDNLDIGCPFSCVGARDGSLERRGAFFCSVTKGILKARKINRQKKGAEMFKRILSMVLVVCMVMLSVPAGVFADPPGPMTDVMPQGYTDPYFEGDDSNNDGISDCFQNLDAESERIWFGTGPIESEGTGFGTGPGTGSGTGAGSPQSNPPPDGEPSPAAKEPSDIRVRVSNLEDEISEIENQFPVDPDKKTKFFNKYHEGCGLVSPANMEDRERLLGAYLEQLKEWKKEYEAAREAELDKEREERDKKEAELQAKVKASIEAAEKRRADKEAKEAQAQAAADQVAAGANNPPWWVGVGPEPYLDAPVPYKPPVINPPGKSEETKKVPKESFIPGYLKFILGVMFGPSYASPKQTSQGGQSLAEGGCSTSELTESGLESPLRK